MRVIERERDEECPDVASDERSEFGVHNDWIRDGRREERARD